MNDSFIKAYKAILALKDINSTDKLILCEIISLCTQKGCFASRTHFCNVLGIKSKTTVSTSWKHLSDSGYIKQKKVVSFNSKQTYTITELTKLTKSYLPNDLVYKDVEFIGFDFEQLSTFDEEGQKY